MNAAAIAGMILSALTAIQSLLPLLGVAGNTATIVTNIISALAKVIPLIEQLAPLAADEIGLIYQGIKNIIANLKGGETTAQQDADLDALDARVDAAWDAIAPQFDPDAAPPVPAPPATPAP